jgi:hypothetical protein
MVLAVIVIGIGYKSDLLIGKGSFNAHRGIQNVDQLRLINGIDQKDRSFGWIFEQDGAPSHTL